MTIISSAQQIINQVVPNITGGATDLVQAFRGSFGADANIGVTSSGNQPDFGSQLEEATSRDRISFDRPDNRGDNNRPNDRSDRPESRADDRRDSRADRASDDRDAVRAERPDRPAGDDSRYNSSDYSGSEELDVFVRSGAADTTNNAQQNSANDNATGVAAAVTEAAAVVAETLAPSAGEEPLGEAGELLAQAEGLLAQLEAFQLDNPEIASELSAIIAPIQQALQQITAQLSALPADAAVTPSALNGNPADALSQLRQISGLFSGLQQAGSIENLSQNLGGAPISEEFSQALRALQNTAGPSLQRVNELVESFRQLVTNANTAPVNAAQAQAQSQAQNQAQNQAQLANGQAAANAANASAAADSAAVSDVGNANQPVGNNVQGVAQLGAANQANQQQVPGAANASANGQAQGIQQAGQSAGGRGDAAASAAAQLAAASSSSAASSSASQPNAAAVNIPTTSVTLTREAASFSQALQQSGRASVAEQVQAQVRTLIRNGQSSVSVRLNPEELGRVDIRLDTDRTSRTQVVVSVERPQTLELLQRDARALLQTLQDAGLQADSEDLAFDLKGGNDSSGGQEQQQARSGYPAADDPLEEELLSNVSGVISENYTVELEQGVNIHA